MTEILCRWLNEQVCVEPRIKVGDEELAEKFSNGYLFGAILYKYELQPDFQDFSKGNNSEAKLNNYTLLEPTFKLLQIPFSYTMACDLMVKTPGTATRLIYQLFLALSKKKEQKLTTQSLECMKSPAKSKLGKVETEIFRDRLKQQTSRQVDLNFQELKERYNKRLEVYADKIAQMKKIEEERQVEERKRLCQRSMEIARATREKNCQMFKNLKPLPSGTRSKSSPELRRHHSKLPKKSVASDTMRSIDHFELQMEKRLSVMMSGSLDVKVSAPTANSSGSNEVETSGSSQGYLAEIHKRVSETCMAQAQREKRRRRVLVEQMKALHELEESKRKRMLVERLNKQSQQERRISTQLMQIRREKDTIRNNRILRLQQYREEREQEYINHLNRLAGEARLEEEERKKRLKHHQKLYQTNLAKKAQMNYEANYGTCYDIVLHIIDFSTKLAHYRELTKNLVPAKMVIDWKALFIAGRPLYESDGIELSNSVDLHSSFMTTACSVEGLKPPTTNDRVLNNIDFEDYNKAQNEWSLPQDMAEEFPKQYNMVLSHAVYRVLDLVDPPKSPPTPPHTPRFVLRASAVGKPFAGKDKALEHIVKKFNLVVISVETITKKAVETYLSESKNLQTQVSGSASNIDYLAEGDAGETNEKEESQSTRTMDTPIIQVDKSSSSLIVAQQKDGGDSARGSGAEASGSQAQVDLEVPEEAARISPEIVEQLSPLAALGYKAHVALVNGDPLDDDLLNDIFIHEIRSLPDSSGWILDDYPTTVEQARMLFSSLSGKSIPRPMISRDFILIGGPKRDKSVLQSSSGLDLLLNFEAATQIILQRASMQGDCSKLGQIQERLVKYNDRWRPLQRWYSKYKIICTVNGMMDVQSVCETVADKIEEVMKTIHQSETIKKLGLSQSGLNSGSLVSLSSMTPSPTKRSTTTTRTPPPTLRRRPSSAKLSLVSGDISESPVPAKSDSTWSPVNLDVTPGSFEWKYYDQPLEMESAQGLAKKWPAIEANYVNTLKEIFQKLRVERELICEYFFIRSKQFSTYLCRPDHKQEFISQWQENYNGLDESLRHEEVVKAELHHRVDDLMDKLWDICERRKSQANEERKRIAEEQWLEDHIGLLSNYYISLMQAELDRFQDTYLYIKDYYDAMEKKMPEKLPDSGRLQLIEMQVTEAQDVTPSQEGSTVNVTTTEGTSVDMDGKANDTASSGKDEQLKLIPLLPRQQLPDPSEEKGTKKKGGGGAAAMPIAGLMSLSGQDMDEQLINHVYNQGLTFLHSLTNAEMKSLDGAIADVSKPPPSEKSQEMSGESKDDQKTAKGKRAKSPANVKKSGSQKKSPMPKKSPTPKKKKGSGKSSTQPPESEQSVSKAVPMTPDVVMKRHGILHRCKEFREALSIEEKHLKARLNLIRQKSLDLIKLLKERGQEMQEEMGSWMESCYSREIESVNQLSNTLRQAIENERKILHEVVLPGPKFNIDKDIITFVPSPAPSPPPLPEPPHSFFFTVSQLHQLFQFLQSSTSTNFILTRSLVNNLLHLVKSSSKDDCLPLAWRSITKKQLDAIVKMVYGRNATNVDWRKFMVCVAQPWVVPSPQQLVEAWTALSDNEQEFMGVVMIDQEKFLNTEFWMDSALEETEESDSTSLLEERKFNRTLALKEALFEITCDSNGLLDVRQFLLYLCADPLHTQGFLKALSVVTATPISSIKEIDPNLNVSLEDFYDVLTWGTPKAMVAISRANLLDVFIQINCSNPNEVSLLSLLNHNLIQSLIQSSNNFFLPDLQQVLGPSEGKLEVPG